MKYNASFFQNVLINNFGYTLVDLDFCKAIEVPAMDGFRYAVISNSGYLDLSQIEKRLIIRKDLFRVFNQAEQESIQHGIFDGNNPVFRYTPNKFFTQYPSIISGQKYIVFLEYDAKAKMGEPPYYCLLRELNSRIVESEMNPLDFIITLVPFNSSPKDLESFFEFYISELYRRKGYLTDSQVPFYYGVGTPDAAAYKYNVFSDFFKEIGICGASTIDLMCLSYQHRSAIELSSNQGAIVFEMKTGSVDGSQIKKYIAKEIFHKAYEVIPHKKGRSEYAGLVHFDDSGFSIVEDSDTMSTIRESDYLNWLITYAKCFIFANISDGMLEAFKDKFAITTTKQIIDKLKSMSIHEIFSMITEE